MTLSHKHLQIISNLYDAAIDPVRWPEILDQVAFEIGAQSSAIILLETLNQYNYSINKMSSSLNSKAEYLKVYERDYAKYEKEHFSRVSRLPAGQIINEIEYVEDPIEFRNRPDVAFLEKNFGFFERFAVRLNEERAWFDCITFQYNVSRGNITDREKKVLQKFLPHIARTTNLSRTFIELKNRYSAVLGVLDRLYVGVFLTLPSGEVLLKNQTADNILSQSDGLLTTKDNKITLLDPNNNALFKQAINNCCATALADRDSQSTKFKIRRPSGKDDYLVDISPVKDTDQEIESNYKGAIVMVIDCEQRLPVNIKGFKEIYELTTAEASVAQYLIEGKKYSEVAEIRGTSPETVKTQVNSVFNKTNSNSRSELFARLLSINLPIE